MGLLQKKIILPPPLLFFSRSPETIKSIPSKYFLEENTTQYGRWIIITTNYRLVTAPVLIPGVPDCDYNNGETPLTTEQIQALMETYKEHQIIDYNHKYMFDGPWYKRNLGEPVNIWQSEKTNTYTDRFGVTRTAPPGTWWQTTKVTDPEAITLIDDEKLNAYSLTTVNKQFLEKFLQVSNTNISTKNDDNIINLLREHGISAKHRTPISKIKEPVAFTVSLTNFPCVGGAVFARDCLEKSKGISNKSRDDIMTEENRNNGGWSMNDVKELFGLFTSIKAEKEEETPAPAPAEKEEEPEKPEDEYVTKEELGTILEDNNKTLISEISELIDKKLKEKDEETEEEAADEKKDEQKTEEKPEEKGAGKVSNKNAEGTTMTKPQSQQLDDPLPEEQYSHKKGTPEYRILQKLGRDALGNSKIRL